jgi:membrane protease YdiL (CAAX protease family)
MRLVTQAAFRKNIPRGSRRRRNRQQAAGSPREAVAAGARAPKIGFGAGAGEGDPQNTLAWLFGGFDAATAANLRQVALICVTACLALGLVQFVGSEQTFLHVFPLGPRGFDSYWVLRYKSWWVAVIGASYLLLPAIVMALMPGNRLRDCNLSFSGFRRHFWIYVGLYGAVLPVIWLVSLTPEFYTFYPMYPQAGRSWFDLLSWEALYAGQFIALEFFFRGFLVGGLSRFLGALAVPVCVMPYLMIHFTKPWPEAAGSVVAGFVLGWLAWKTKSIWGGVCVHCAVASTMDLLALAHKGQLPWLHS